VAETRRGLGRGLAALLGEAGEADAPGGGAPLDVREIPIERIRANPHQPRTRIDEGALAALAESIKLSGIVQPVLVRPAGEDGLHELIAGERRWRASRRAGLTSLPAVVRQVGDRERLELALVENMVREDLSPIEVATACATLIEDFGQSHAQVAAQLGRSRPAISNLLRLLELPDDVQALIADGRLSEGAARAVLMADGARARRRLAERAVAEGLSVRAVEAAARGGREARGRQEAAPADQEGLDDALDAFSQAFGAAVRGRGLPGGGVAIELRVPDEDALGELAAIAWGVVRDRPAPPGTSP
jgi:ParB family chromosome partitioning protein